MISLSRGIFEISIPVQPEKSTSPPMVEAYFFTSSSFAWASSSVRPTIGVKVAKNLIEDGSRPFSCASFRMLSIFGRSTLGSCDETKIASACVAAKELPALMVREVSTLWSFSLEA